MIEARVPSWARREPKPPVLLSGVLRGSVTVYAATTGSQIGQVGYGDDLVYAQEPAAVTCANLLGVISDDNQMIIDNSVNSPQRASGSNGQWHWTDGDDNGMSTSHDFVLHGVTMSRLGTVGVENFSSHPEYIGPCNAAISGRGCIRQAGGVIETVISATYHTAGADFGEPGVGAGFCARCGGVRANHPGAERGGRLHAGVL